MVEFKQLARDPDVLSRNTAQLDSFTDFSFVLVAPRTVDVSAMWKEAQSESNSPFYLTSSPWRSPIARLESGTDGVTYFALAVCGGKDGSQQGTGGNAPRPATDGDCQVPSPTEGILRPSLRVKWVVGAMVMGWMGVKAEGTADPTEPEQASFLSA